jgi:tetratricopeptide (TPR) repeat protein
VASERVSLRTWDVSTAFAEEPSQGSKLLLDDLCRLCDNTVSTKEAGLNEHPSREEVVALYREDLSPERAEEVLGHLLAPCASCLDEMALAMGLGRILELRREPVVEKKRTSYDAAINRTLRKVARYERYLRQQRAKAIKALRVLETGGMEALDRLSPRLDPFARMEAFLARSWQLRHDSPQLMIHFAFFATKAAQQLEARRFDSPARMVDFQARTHAELGNAYRVSDRLQEAAHTLGRARQLFESGTRDKSLEVRLLELEASLVADRREFGRASAILLKVAAFYNQNNDPHLVGRTLIKIGLYTGYRSDFEKAVELLGQGIALIDAGRDRSLACAAAHNLVLFLVDSGRFPEAKKMRLVYSRHLMEAGGRVNEVKFRALEGRIDSGLGNYLRAETVFREVQRGYEEVGRYDHAAITALDLAFVLLAQRKAREATAVILETADTFTGLNVKPEALQAVILLRDAVEMQTATLEMVEEVAKFLRRIDIDPTLRFEGRAWED